MVSSLIAVMLPAYILGVITGVFLEHYGQQAYLEKKRDSGD